jgi:hypothetical protein
MVVPGPRRHVVTGDGFAAPFYEVSYDKDGRDKGPLTSRHLVARLAPGHRDGEITDVFVFSHGWNNDYATASARYANFITEFSDIRAEHPVSLGRDFRPVLVGIFWPSTALVWPWEQGPRTAAVPGVEEAVDVADDPELREAVDAMAAVLPADERDRFYALVEQPSLDRSDAAALAGLLNRVAGAGDPDISDPDTDADVDPLHMSGLIEGWEELEKLATGMVAVPVDPEAIGDLVSDPVSAPVSDVTGEPRAQGLGSGTPDAAGLVDVLQRLDPRQAIRLATVRQMKDRAGIIGTRGVGPLLRRLLDAAPAARVHLVGHSYGARVVLNAVSRPEGGPLGRQIDSMLLLQPAVNHLCFAAALPGKPGRAGGYRAALTQVKSPILSTFSPHDAPLTKVFHLALWRDSDLGDLGVAAAGEPPSKYAALGGFGPRGEVPWKEVRTKLPTQSPPSGDDFYDLRAEAPRVWALDGSLSIDSHGGVVNPSTAWALLCLVKGP